MGRIEAVPIDTPDSNARTGGQNWPQWLMSLLMKRYGNSMVGNSIYRKA